MSISLHGVIFSIFVLWTRVTSEYIIEYNIPVTPNKSLEYYIFHQRDHDSFKRLIWKNIVYSVYINSNKSYVGIRLILIICESCLAGI